MRGGVGPGRTGSPQFPGAGRAQGVREPPSPPQVGAPPDPCPVPPQLCISTVAVMITGARPEDTGPPANTHPRAHSRVCPCTHTQTHAGPSFTRAGRLRAQPVGEGLCPGPRSPGTHAGRGPAPTAGDCAQRATDKARPPPGSHPTRPHVPQPTQPPQLSSLPGQSPVWGMQGPHRFPRGAYPGRQPSVPRGSLEPRVFPWGPEGGRWPRLGLSGPGWAQARAHLGTMRGPHQGRSRREGAPLLTTALGRGRPPLHGPGGQACQMAALSPGCPFLGGQRGKPPRS